MSSLNNLRVAARTWRKTLALGIGATTTVFTLTYSVLLRPFPFPDADRLVWITTHSTLADDGELVLNSNRMPIFADWHERLMSVDRIAAWSGAARPDVYT